MHTPDAFWETVFTRLGVEGIDAQEASAAYISSYELRIETIDLIKRLRQDFQVVLLSNLTPEMTSHIRKEHEVEALFNRCFFSCEIGSMKPHAEPYETVLREIGSAPSDCIFIDDSQQNIVAAKSVGIDGILYSDEASLLHDLVHRGIRVTFLPNNHSQFAITEVDPTDDEMEDVNRVLKRHYGFSTKTARRIDLPKRNSVNFRVSGERGEFFFRECRGPYTRRVILRAHEIMRHCQSQQVPVPEIVNSVSGTSLVEDDGLYALFTFIDGTHFRGEVRELIDAGTQVARLHRAFADLPDAVVDELKQSEPLAYAATPIANENLDRYAQIAREGTTSFDRTAMALIPELKRATDAVLDFQRGGSDPPQQVIHSDLHPHNFQSDNGRLCAIFDYDAVRRGKRISDISFALQRLVRQVLVYNGRYDVEFGTECVRGFLSAYHRENSLQPEELEILTDVMKEEMVQKLHFLMQMRYDRNDPTWDADFVKFVMLYDEIGYFETLSIAVD